MTTTMGEEQDNGGPDFEASLKELEAVVTRLEKGELSLEESLQSFERGVALTRHCQKALREAEQKVESLLGDEEQPSPLEEPADDD